MGVAARMVQALIARAANLIDPAAVGGGLAEAILQFHKHMSIRFKAYCQRRVEFNQKLVPEQLPATTAN